MEWRDDGVVLSVRKHGETSAIAELLTAQHGRSLGLVRGGRSRVMRPVLQPGNLVQVTWRARIEDQLGQFTLEPLALKAGLIMDNPLRLAGLTTLTGLCQLLPEREPHERLYQAFHVVLEAMENDQLWPALLVRWELGLLEELGFGLDLSHCAATGATFDLCYVSPRTGRAVSRAAGEPYKDRLFPLPPFLTMPADVSAEDIVAGFRLTGYFLDRHVFHPRVILMPTSRAWMVDALAQRPH
jgi:DNA repair protein RecO (recombination protein O)